MCHLPVAGRHTRRTLPWPGLRVVSSSVSSEQRARGDSSEAERGVQGRDDYTLVYRPTCDTYLTGFTQHTTRRPTSR